MHCVGFELALSSHPTSREKGGLLSAGLKKIDRIGKEGKASQWGKLRDWNKFKAKSCHIPISEETYDQ